MPEIAHWTGSATAAAGLACAPDEADETDEADVTNEADETDEAGESSEAGEPNVDRSSTSAVITSASRRTPSRMRLGSGKQYDSRS
jgi:hypothetical protein